MPHSDKFAKYPNNVTEATIKLLSNFGLDIETADLPLIDAHLTFDQVDSLIETLKPGSRPSGFASFTGPQKMAYLEAQFKNWRLRQQAINEEAVDTAEIGPRSDELLTATLKGLLVKAAGDFLAGLSAYETHRVACLIARRSEVNGTVEELRAFILEAASEALFDIPIDMISDEVPDEDEEMSSSAMEAFHLIREVNGILASDRSLVVRTNAEGNKIDLGVRDEIKWL